MLRIVAFAAFGGLLVGYDMGLIGGALQGIKVELGLSEGQQVRGGVTAVLVHTFSMAVSWSVLHSMQRMHHPAMRINAATDIGPLPTACVGKLVAVCLVPTRELF